MKKTIIGIVVAVLAIAGCRQKDVRDFSVDVPALAGEKAADVEKDIRMALAPYNGVDKSTLNFDVANHCVTMKYDSMQIAKKNIELAIAKVGWTANGATPESVGAKSKDNESTDKKSTDK